MKYGIIVYKNIPKGREGQFEYDKARFNIGDNIQMLAMRRILTEEMGVSVSDIAEVDFHELGTYKGEQLIVPVNLFFFGMHDAKETWFPCSPYIIPVFIGLHLSVRTLNSEEIGYLMNYEPIGCRDEYTLRLMRRYGIPAYLFSCVTATLPKRDEKPKLNCTYLVDVDKDEILARMPEHLRNNVKSVSHEFSDVFSRDAYLKADELAGKILSEYKEKATLVITSRMHCASPCVAMGIPTIMVVKERSERFSWLEKLIPVYTEDEYDSIDWDITAPDFDDVKSRMILIVIRRLREVWNRYEYLFDVSRFYENEEGKGYLEPFQAFFESLNSLIRKGLNGYYIWGATVLAEDTYRYMSLYEPKAELKGFIDTYNEVKIGGIESITVEKISGVTLHKGELIVVTPTSAKESIYCDIRKHFHEGGGSILFSDGEIICF